MAPVLGVFCALTVYSFQEAAARFAEEGAEEAVGRSTLEQEGARGDAGTGLEDFQVRAGGLLWPYVGVFR